MRVTECAVRGQPREEDDVVPIRNKSSLCVDLLNGRKTEVDFIYGSVIQKGVENQVPTPTLQVLHGLVKGIEARNISIA